MKKLSYGLGATALLSFGACADAGTPFNPLDLGANGTGIGVAIAPLTLANVSDACYSFEIVNGSAERVVARGSQQNSLAAGQGGDGGPIGLSGVIANPICGSQFGFGGEISYVAPCDASPGDDDVTGNPIAEHTVTLWVNSVCTNGTTGVAWNPTTEQGCEPLPGFVNPCGATGCDVITTCVENSDTPVTFNFTVMASAQQGFFDVAVNFDNVFCSAKLDTCYTNEEGSAVYPDDAINLLFPDGGTTRAHTAVAAVSCTTGPTPAAEPDAINTYLHMSDFVVSCDGSPDHTLNLSTVSAEGNVSIGNLDGAVYFGTESLTDMNKVYTTVAFVLPETGECRVRWTVVPSTNAVGPTASNGGDGTYTQVAGVDFANVDVYRGACHRNQLNSNPNAQTSPTQSQVVTEYFEDSLVYTSKLVQNATTFSGP